MAVMANNMVLADAILIGEIGAVVNVCKSRDWLARHERGYMYTLVHLQCT